MFNLRFIWNQSSWYCIWQGGESKNFVRSIRYCNFCFDSRSQELISKLQLNHTGHPTELNNISIKNHFTKVLTEPTLRDPDITFMFNISLCIFWDKAKFVDSSIRHITHTTWLIKVQTQTMGEEFKMSNIYCQQLFVMSATLTMTGNRALALVLCQSQKHCTKKCCSSQVYCSQD